LLGRILILFFFISILLFNGCRPVHDENTPEGITALAEAAMNSGNHTKALRLYSRALEEFPGDIRYASWHLGRAGALLAMKRPDEAEQSALKAVEEAPDAHTKASAMLMLARISFARGAFRNAFRRLSEVHQENLDEAESSQAVELARTCLRKLDTDYLASRPATGWTEVLLLLELEKRYASAGDYDKALMVGTEIDRRYPDAHDRYGRLEIHEPERMFIALVMPFSGEGAVYAEKVARGVRMAFEMSSDLSMNAPILLEFDCSMEDVVDIMRSLGDNSSCLAVIGPLTSRNAELAAPVVRRSSLPMITPTATSNNLDSFGEYVHRLVVSTGEAAGAVAEYAVREAGCNTFAVIHEYTSQSVSEAEQFVSVVRELGGEIVAVEGYETGSTDFKEQINAVKHGHPDGIFLPVSAWDAIQIAPQLRFYMVDAALFGDSGWDDEILLEHGGEYVEGAVFPVSFRVGSINPATARFSYHYRRRYDEQPNILAAQGYDTAMIILDACRNAGLSRTSLERYLQGLEVYYGATGACTIGSVSIPRSAYPLVKIIDGEIIGID